MQGLTDELLTHALSSGATRGGVCETGPHPEAARTLRAHQACGFSGPLRFTYEDPVRATDVTRSFPWARSLVVLAHDYLEDSHAPAGTGALVARFATADHYRPLREAAEAVAGLLEKRGHRAEILIDDNRLADRLPALASGMGWRGRNTMVLIPGLGPWALLGSVITDALLEPTPPTSRTCGTCTACIPACPTAALGPDGLDARRCLSTWLQTNGSIPHWIRPLLGRRIYGCDDCLVACPPGQPRLRRAASPASELSFAGLLASSDNDLLDRFAHWYVPDRHPRYLRRNIMVAAGNSGEPSAWPGIRAHLDHRSEIVRGHAAWAVARSGMAGSEEILERRGRLETVPGPIEEIGLALQMLRDPDGYHQMLARDEEKRSAPRRVAKPVAQ